MLPCLHEVSNLMPGCPVCELHKRFPRRWFEDRPPLVQTEITDYIPEITPVCFYRGALVPLADRYKLELGVLKDWYRCGKGHGKNGYVCPCEGCNPMCPDYKATEIDS